MTKYFSGLSPAELERLALLGEEMGEASQVIGKIIRHGYGSKHPDHPAGPNNRRLLEKELGDVRAAFFMMCHAGDIDFLTVDRHTLEKHESVKKYLHHQPTG